MRNKDIFYVGIIVFIVRVMRIVSGIISAVLANRGFP